MTRRVFLSTLAASTALRAGARPATRISLAPIQGRFHKFVAMNSYDTAPKGHTYTNTLVRIATDAGAEGVGAMGYAAPDDDYRAALRALIGADSLSIFTMQGGVIAGRAPAWDGLLTKYLHLDAPLLDLIGKLQNKPVWKLLGEPVRDSVEVYDGTLYFSDVWFKDRGVRAVIEEAEEAVKSGYLGLKFKVGRGWKWMTPAAGLDRDIEVLLAARKAVGPDIKILADANDGYRNDFEGAWRLMRETRDASLYWMEEIFPEDVDRYAELRKRMAEEGIRTYIADGENLREPEAFKPYLKPPRAFDVVQMDIRVGGFLANRELARMAGAVGAFSVPHNWASEIGKYMGLHLAKAVREVTAAEDDRSTCDAIKAEGYEFHKGNYTVSNSPGLGLSVNADIYREKYARSETVISEAPGAPARSMFVCPNCTKRLANSINPSGPSWRCGACGGIAFPVATLRKTQVSEATIEGLLEKARAGEGVKGRFCPICANWMCGLPVPVENDSVTIDVCNSCQLFWFDPKEFESVLPPPAAPPAPSQAAGFPSTPMTISPSPVRDSSPLAAGRRVGIPAPMAAAELEGYEQEARLRWWNYLSGFLGMPIEIRSPIRKKAPSATQTLAAVTAGVSFSVYTLYPGVVGWLGFSPESQFRFLGLTLITAFFLHGGLFHLLGNLYFLMTFGDNVEDFLGIRRFLLLILGATVFGNLLQYAASPNGNMLIIGASGGIAGIVAFYGLQFRQARVAIFLLRIIPVKLKAFWALALWFGFQLVGTAAGWVNTDHTAYAAHLGGAATGLILWRFWQEH